MNIGFFNKLWREAHPQQQRPEWLMFLKLCEVYLKEYKIKNPIAVELGVRGGHQKRFYEQLLNAEHIGTDISNKRSIPDILGNNHASETFKKLKEKLNGRSIDILFIDASHRYEDVKKDYEIYSPLCNGIIGFHDVETRRHANRESYEVWRFWDELREKSFSREKLEEKFLFLTLHQCHVKDDKSRRVGIGVIIKR